MIDWSVLNQVLLVFQQNPILLGLLISVLRNIGGYIAECFTQKKIVMYEGSKLLETLAVYETFFIAAGQIGGLPNSWTIVIAVAVDIIRSLKKGVSQITAEPVPEPRPTTVPEPVITYGAWREQLTVLDSAYGKAGTKLWTRQVYTDGVFDHEEVTTTQPLELVSQ